MRKILIILFIFVTSFINAQTVVATKIVRVNNDTTTFGTGIIQGALIYDTTSYYLWAAKMPLSPILSIKTCDTSQIELKSITKTQSLQIIRNEDSIIQLRIDVNSKLNISDTAAMLGHYLPLSGGTITNSISPQLTIYNPLYTAVSNYASLDFNARLSSGQGTIYSKIYSKVENNTAGNNESTLRFQTAHNGTVDDKMTLDSVGNLNITGVYKINGIPLDYLTSTVINDSLSNHLTLIKANRDSIAVHLDTLKVHRIDINKNKDSISIHLDTLQSHNIRILNNLDSITVHRVAINNNIDSLSNHLDTLKQHRIDINNHTDSLAVHLDTIKQLRIDVNSKLPIADVPSILLPYVKIDGTTPFTAPQQGIFPVASNDLATKEYVDNSVSLIFDFYFTNTLADVSGYYRMINDAVGEPLVSFNNTVGAGASQLIVPFISDTSQPGVTLLKKGVYEVAIRAYVTGAGSLTTNLYYSLYLRDTLGTETLLGTSSPSPNLTAVGETYNLTVVRDTIIEINSKDRLVAKIYANVTGGTGTTETLTLQAGNGTGSKLAIPTSSEILSTIFLRQDGTTPLNANWNAGNHNITVDSLKVHGGTANQFLMADGSRNDTIYAVKSTINDSLSSHLALIKSNRDSISILPRKNNVIWNQDTAVQNANFRIKYGEIQDSLLAGKTSISDSLNVSNAINVGLKKNNLPTGINYFNITQVSNDESFGIVSQARYYKTSSDFAAPIVGVLGRVYLDTLNSKNWTHEFGLIGVEGSVRSANGSSGTIANAESFLSRTELGGSTAKFTNVYGVRIRGITSYPGQSLTISDSVVKNWYGLYIGSNVMGWDSTYAIFTNKGLVHFGDNTDITGNITATGNATAAKFITSGGTSSQFVKGDGTLDGTSYYPASNPNGYTTNTGTVTSIATTAPLTGGTITTSGTLGITQSGTASNGYLSSTDWTNFNAGYTDRIASFTTTGNSGAATFSGNTLNIPNYTLSGLGYTTPTLAQVTTVGNTTTNGVSIGSLSATTGSFSSTLTAAQVNPTNLSTGYIPYQNGSYLVNSPAEINGTNFGIGIIPNFPLSVNGTAFIGSSTLGGLLFTSGTGVANIIGSSYDINTKNDINIRATSGTQLFLGTSGFVGIGYSSDPTSGNKLAVNGAAYFNGNITATGNATAAKFIIPGGTSAQYLLADGSTTSVAGAVYKGQLDGSTGIPVGGSTALIDGTGTIGWYYACSVAGTYDYGNPSGNSITLAVGDQLYYTNGGTWTKIPGAGSYTLPIATATNLGGIKVGTGLSINSSSGVLSTVESDPVWISDSSDYAKKILVNDTASAIRTSLNNYIPLSGTSSLSGSIIPSVTGTNNLGSSSKMFSYVYTNNIFSPLGIFNLIQLNDSLIGGYLHPDSIKAMKFITQSGTSSDFVKGNGSLDNSTYLTTTAASTNYIQNQNSGPQNADFAINGVGSAQTAFYSPGYGLFSDSIQSNFIHGVDSVTSAFMHATGNMKANDFVLNSDSTLKHEIKPLITNVSSVPLVQFKFKADTTNRERYGVIAQTLQKVDSNMVYKGSNGKLEVSYIGFLVARLANDEAKIDSLKSVVSEQQKQIDYILKQLKEIKHEK